MNGKIAFYIPNMKSGGAEKVFQILSNQLVSRNFKVDLLLSKIEGDYLSNLDPRINIIELGRGSVRNDFFSLIKYFLKNRPNYVLSGLTHANLIVLLAKFFVPLPIKLFISEHSITTGYAGLKKNRLQNFLIKFLYPNAKGIIAVSKTTKDDLMKNYFLSNNKIKVIYNPVLTRSLDLALLEKNDDINFNIRKGFYIFVGRLEMEKNIFFLIEALKEKLILQDKTLLIFGEGSLRINVEEFIIAEKLSNHIKVCGFKKNPYKYMKNADALILPSLFEGFGNVAIEALYSGTKVLISEKARAALEITHDSNGQAVYFNPHDAGDFQEKIKLLEKSEGKADEEYFNQFKEENITNQYIHYLKTGR